MNPKSRDNLYINFDETAHFVYHSNLQNLKRKKMGLEKIIFLWIFSKNKLFNKSTSFSALWYKIEDGVLKIIIDFLQK